MFWRYMLMYWNYLNKHQIIGWWHDFLRRELSSMFVLKIL